MNNYVFIDDNNGHFCEYYNFSTDASTSQIQKATQLMKKENPAYGRMGSNINDLSNKLQSMGFQCNIENNPKNRRYIDRESVYCISGNY